MPRFIDQGYVPFGDNGKPEDRSESGMGPQKMPEFSPVKMDKLPRLPPPHP